MKKKILLYFIILAFILFTGCSQIKPLISPTPTPSPIPTLTPTPTPEPSPIDQLAGYIVENDEMTDSKPCISYALDETRTCYLSISNGIFNSKIYYRYVVDDSIEGSKNNSTGVDKKNLNIVFDIKNQTANVTYDYNMSLNIGTFIVASVSKYAELDALALGSYQPEDEQSWKNCYLEANSSIQGVEAKEITETEYAELRKEADGLLTDAYYALEETLQTINTGTVMSDFGFTGNS